MTGRGQDNCIGSANDGALERGGGGGWGGGGGGLGGGGGVLRLLPLVLRPAREEYTQDEVGIALGLTEAHEVEKSMGRGSREVYGSVAGGASETRRGGSESSDLEAV